MVHKKISTLWNCAVLIHIVTTRNLVEHFRLFHLTLKEPKKCIWKNRLLKSSAANNCLTLLTNISIEANSVDPDQTAPIGAVWSGFALFVIEASLTFQQTRKQTTFVVPGALSVNYKNIKERLIKNKGILSLLRTFQKTLVSYITWTLISFHVSFKDARIQKCLSGVPGLSARKQPGQHFVVLSLFYSFRGGKMVLLQRKLYFLKDLEGSQHFPRGGGSNFFQWGFPNGNFYRNPYNLWFIRGGGGGVGLDPLSPSGSAHD